MNDILAIALLAFCFLGMGAGFTLLAYGLFTSLELDDGAGR